MSCKYAEARARRVLVCKIISPIRGFACAIRMIDPTFPASPIFYINFEKTRLKLWRKKDHNILWSKWYSRRESNPQRPLRWGLLYPFKYGSVLNFIARGRNHCRKKLYTKIYTSFFPPPENKPKSIGFSRKPGVLGTTLWI